MLENQLSLPDFSGFARERLEQILGPAFAAARDGIEEALVRMEEDLRRAVFFHTGPIVIDGRDYDAVITPHFHNARPGGGADGNHNYVAFLRAPDGKIATVVLRFADSEVADIRFLAEERISAALKNTRRSNGRLFYKNGDLYSGDFGGFRYDKIGMRFYVAHGITERFLKGVGGQAPLYKGLVDGDVDRLHKEFAGVLQGETVERRNREWLSFYGKLRAAALEFLEEQHEARIELYNFFANRDFSERTMDFRRGALEVLARMDQYIGAWPPDHAKAFWEIIDAGQPLPEALAGAFGLPKTVVKKAVGELDSFGKFGDELTVPDRYRQSFFIKERKKEYGYVKYFACEPNLPWPRSQPEWRAFIAVAGFAAILSSGYHSLLPGSTPREARLLMNVWKSLKEKSWLSSELAFFCNQERHRDVEDMVESMFAKLVLPVMVRSRPGEFLSEHLASKIKGKIFQLYDFPRIMAASRYWHANRAQFPQGVAVEADGKPAATEWIALADEVTAPNGTVMTPLTSIAALNDEAAIMDHCVDEYAWKCMQYSSHIFSLTGGEGSGRSTLQIVSKKELNSFHINQNKSYHNDPASAESWAAAEWLVGRLNGGHIKTNIPEIRAVIESRWREAKEHALEMQRMRIGFDPGDLAMCEHVRKLYSRCLPSPIRDEIHSVGDFLKIAGIDRLLKKHGYAAPVRRKGAAVRRGQPEAQRAAA